MDAFKFGIIDETGKKIRDLKGKDSVDAFNSYTSFHKLVFNIKRLIEKVPGGKSKFVSFGTALMLLRENFKEKIEDKNLFEKTLSTFLEDDATMTTDAIDADLPVPIVKMIKKFKKDNTSKGKKKLAKFAP